MKIILTVHQFLPDYYAGTEIITLNIAKELMRRGHDVTVVTGFPTSEPLPDSERFDSYSYEGIPVERFLHSHAPMGGRNNVVELSYNNPLFGRFFHKLLREKQPDVVHFVHLARLSASAIEACVQLKVPMVYTATDFWMICPLHQLRLPDNSMCAGPDALSANCVRHYMDFVGQIQSIHRSAGGDLNHPAAGAVPPEILARASKIPDWLLRFLVRAANRNLVPVRSIRNRVKALSARPQFMRRQMNKINVVLAPSQIVQKILIRNGVKAERVRLLPYGINLGPIPRRTDKGKQRQLRVGFIGSLYEHKGCHLLVEAVKALDSESAVELKIYGRSDPGWASAIYFDPLQELIGDDPRIELCGGFPNDRVGEVLSSLDVLVVPSIWYENTPIVIYEALTAGCPVIATDLSGMSEIVHHEVNGLLFPVGDVAALKNCLQRLAEDRILLKRLAAHTQTPNSIAEHVSELENIYREITSETVPLITS
ncbi:D-inositol-3-phosphate glycosyltransferase [Abditibacteriota bacterium]|nr:D-inositol-3-phosphate glycosyltransferase [Abditibacteriota bacterium]